MIKCKIDNHFVCNKQVHTGKGGWMWLDVCTRCRVFKLFGQSTLAPDFKRFKFLCPECLLPNTYHSTPSNTFLCVYCGSLFKIDEVFNE